MTTQVRRIPMWIRALAAGVLAAVAVTAGLVLAGSAGASPSPVGVKGPVCASPGTPGHGTGAGTGAIPLSPAKGKGEPAGSRGVPKTHPPCAPGPGAPAPTRVR